jgi:hypothetical protein
MVFDQGDGSDILDAIVAEGRCGTSAVGLCRQD